jgi:hypothetical protein
MNGAQGMLIVLLVISILSVIMWPPLAVVAAIGIALYVFSPPSITACGRRKPSHHHHERMMVARAVNDAPAVVVGEGLEAHLHTLETAKAEQDRAAQAVELLVDEEFAQVNAEIRADVAARPEDHTGAVSLASNELLNANRKNREYNAKLMAPDNKYYQTVHDPTGLREQMLLERDELTAFYNRGGIDHSMFGHYDS